MRLELTLPDDLRLAGLIQEPNTDAAADCWRCYLQAPTLQLFGATGPSAQSAIDAAELELRARLRELPRREYPKLTLQLKI